MDALIAIATVVRRPQDELPKVVRWNRLSGKLEQNVLQHTHGLQILAIIVAAFLEEAGHKLDMGVVHGTCVLHDHGEMEHGDLPAPDKKNEHDIAEYHAFCKQNDLLHPVVRDKKKRLFLVQFAGKSDEDRAEFPKEAQEHMNWAREHHPNEVRFFRMLEILDYLMHAFAGYFLVKCTVVIDEILHGYIPVMRRYVKEIPGLQMVWSPEVDQWCDTYVQKAAA